MCWVCCFQVPKHMLTWFLIQMLFFPFFLGYISVHVKNWKCIMPGNYFQTYERRRDQNTFFVDSFKVIRIHDKIENNFWTNCFRLESVSILYILIDNFQAIIIISIFSFVFLFENFMKHPKRTTFLRFLYGCDHDCCLYHSLETISEKPLHARAS